MSERSGAQDGTGTPDDAGSDGRPLSVQLTARDLAEYRRLRSAADDAASALRALTDEWRARANRALGGSGRHGTVLIMRGQTRIGAYVSAQVVRLLSAAQVRAALPPDQWALVHTERTEARLTLELRP